MLARHWLFPKLGVTVALVLFTTSSLALAAHTGERSRPLDAGGRLAPIGKLYSLGAVMIDSRTLSGEQLLWGGEQIWAKEASANVHLDGVGQVLLYRGSIARLLMSVSPDRAVTDEPVLTAVLSAGEIAMSLDSDASARVVVGDTIYRASRGAKFKVRTADDERAFDVKTGVITREALPQHARYDVSRVYTNRSGQDTGPAPQKKQVPKKKRAPDAVKLQELEPSKAPTKASFQTDSLQQPAKGIVGVKVKFCLVNNPTNSVFLPSRSVCETVETNRYGVAIVEFEAGPILGTSTIKAEVLSPSEGSWSGETEVVKGPTDWKKVAILAAVIGGVICAFKCRKHQTPPLQQVPPPNIP